MKLNVLSGHGTGFRTSPLRVALTDRTHCWPVLAFIWSGVVNLPPATTCPSGPRMFYDRWARDAAEIHLVFRILRLVVWSTQWSCAFLEVCPNTE